MSSIHAKKTLGVDKGSRKTVCRKFQKTAWDRLGKDKGGWELISEEDYLKLDPVKKMVVVKAAEDKVEKPEEVAKGEKGSGEPVAPPVKTGIDDITIPDVIVALKKLNTSEEVDAYVGSDERKGVKAAAVTRKEEIEEAAEASSK